MKKEPKPPKVSICIPFYPMENHEFFMKRCLDSIREQSFTDYEIVITDKGGMAENTNNAIKQATGEIIKVLYMDDYFSHKHALKRIVEAFNSHWMIVGADNNPHPYWTDDIHTGNNRLGSPSALVIENKNPLLFDEKLGWLLDCDLYKRMYERYGPPAILNEVMVNIGIHPGQATNTMGEQVKLQEELYMRNKYEI